MDASRLADTLDALVRKYRQVPFSSWAKVYACGDRINDYDSGNPEHPDWWQAHTDVLEIVTDGDGRKWANVCIVLYPQGMHSSPPAPAAGLAIYADGRVEGAWANGDEFDFVQVPSGAA